jgi:CheY-like chemotaxis protein
VRCDRAQLQQVLMNLAANARDAMPRGGRLRIETANVEVGPELAATLPGLTPGPHVRIGVRDDGEGLSPEARAHLFEPFFTTKPVGSGTGLGLATSYGIVSQSGGSIAVEAVEAGEQADAERGAGTTFALYFPRAEGTPVSLAPPPPSRPAVGHETVLLVEDEPAVATVIERILGQAGHVVLRARDGEDAIELARTEARLDLLLTDVVLPGLDGRQIEAEVGKLHPEARVLFISGFTEETIVQHGVVDAGVSFLPKPFTPATLLARVRAVIGA